jgi:DNA-directed RNA polymerase specialized sigma24 family protein
MPVFYHEVKLLSSRDAQGRGLAAGAYTWQSSSEHRRPRRSPTATLQPAPAPYDDATLAVAFRDLHGSRLHGFAMLVTLGDRQSAELVAGFALAAGAEQAAALRHPERAAAWLRARALRTLHQRRSIRRKTPDDLRRATLATLGVDEAAFRGLAALSVDARAALVASAIERFDEIDIETILDASPSAARHAVAEARERYVRYASATPSAERDEPDDSPSGELASRVRDVAARAFSRGEAAR